MHRLSVLSRLHVAKNDDQPVEFATGTIRGQEHLIVPCVMISEGVLHSSNNDQPSLALASEFGMFPAGWDGRPVVFNHPMVNDEAVSANRPEGWSEEVIGFVFNTKLDGKKLPAELWLDTSRAPEELLSGLREGKEFEVSTGLWAAAEEQFGIFNDRKYEEIWRNVVPDHLAILEPGTIGACSIADGCGIPSMVANATRSFVMPQKDCSCQTSGGNTVESEPKQNASGIAPTMSRFFRNTVPAGIQAAYDKLTKLFSANELSDNDVRTALQLALNEADYPYASVVAVYDKTVVYSAMDRETYDWKLYQVDYSVVEGGAVTLGSAPIEVRPETAYVPVQVASKSGEEGPINSALKEETMQLTAEQLSAITAQVQAAMVANSTQAATTQAASTAAAAEPKPTNDLSAVLAAATPELRSEIEAAMKANQQIREGLVANLKTKGFSETELAGLSNDMLTRMNSLAPAAQQQQTETKPKEGTDFTGAGAFAANASALAANSTPPMPVFPAEAAA